MKTIGTFHIVLLSIVCGVVRKGANKAPVTHRNNRNIMQGVKLITLSLLFLLLAYESANAQIITLDKKKASLATILFDITKLGYNFSYDDAFPQKAEKITININISKGTLTEILDMCFRQQPFQYSIVGKNITIRPKEMTRDESLQGYVITGKITDHNGNALPGANIRVKNGETNATADGNGNFELTKVTPNSTVEISYVGYESRLIKVGDEKNISIRLDAMIKSLDEVITNGYRTTTRRDNLGSTVIITAEEIERQPVNNILAAMEGRITGMNVTQRSGLPGSPFTVQIRGQRSIGVNPNTQLPANSPLFIIDGIPFLSSSEKITQRGNIQANSPFSTINPADIESIQVLKDANATSIYGSLGANGVVLITTKKPTSKGISVTANMYAGISKITRAIDYMNTEQYLQMRREAFANDGETPDALNAYDLLTWNTKNYTNWKKLLIGGTGHISDANIRYSGGSASTYFALGVGYNKETTVFPGKLGKSLTSINLNIEHKSLNNKLELSVVASYGYDKSNLMSHDPTNGINSPPNAPLPYDSLGRLNFRDNGHPFNNPLSYLFQPYTFIMERLTGGIKLNYKIMPWLTLKTNAGYTLLTGDEALLLPIASQDPAGNPSPTGSASFGNSKNRNWIIEPQLEFVDSVGKGGLKVIAGTSLRNRTGITDLQDGSGYTNDAGLNSINNAASYTATHDYNQYRVISAYGLANYSWDRKYLAEATIRTDGSSRFGPSKRFGSFVSAAAGWIFSDEKFMDHLPFISFGKIRASYGTTGNDQIGDYQFLDAWVNNPRFPYQIPTFMPSKLANADYHWEIQKSIDIGMELGFCNNRIMLNTTLNQSRTTDQLIAITLPAQAGFSKVIRNFPAVTQNRNLEIELNTINIRNGIFKWRTSLNLTIQKNKLLKFPGIESTDYGINKFVIGQPLNLVWGLRTAGLDAASGIYRFIDKNGDVVHIPTSLPSSNDYMNLGTYDPSYFGGLQNSFEYGNWQLHFLFQFVKQMGQHSIYINDKTPGSIANQSADLLNRWQKPGDAARYQQYTQSIGTPAYYSWYFINTSDLSLTDASYIRLKNLSLSYTLPEKWFNKLKLKNCRVYAQGQNLMTFTHFIGNDPETSENRDGLPPLKVYTVGIQASF